MTHDIADALKTERRAAMEECAALVEPEGKRPCDCTRCYCLKPEDAQAVEAWDTMTNLAAEIRRRMEEQDRGAEP